ncbi:MAG: TrkH family potassium uptake protein [Clostridia bacterium]
MFYAEQLRNRYRLIVSYVGTITMGAGVILLSPLLILPFYPDETYMVPYFLISSLLALVAGYLMHLTPVDKSKNTNLSLPEGGVIVVLSWFLTIFFSALPFIFSGMLNFTQAIFEVVSGWTTTGLSVVDVVEAPKIILIWRSIMHFFGGAGLAVIMLSAIIGPHGLGLYIAEGRSDKLLPSIAKSTKMILSIYSGYVIAGTILYILAGMSIFDSINHSMAALSTGGFSTQPDSIAAYNSFPIELITIVLMLLGTINFAAHYVLLKGKFKEFFKIDEVKFMIILLIIVIPLVVFVSLTTIYPDIGESFRIGAFELISALTTTGYSTVGYGDWPIFAVFVMIVLMSIGGGTGSTAGGIKQYRVSLILKSLYWNIRSYLQPKSLVEEHHVNRPEGKFFVSKEHSLEVANFTFLYMLTYIIGVGIFLAYGFPLKESMFEFASALGTVGLSIGITAPGAPAGILWTETFGMFLGRLEFFVIFFAIIKMIKDSKYIVKSKSK